MSAEQRQNFEALGPKKVEQERAKWQQLKDSTEQLRDHPLRKELAEIGAKAARIWETNVMLMQIPNSGEQILKNWEKMKELYGQAMDVRARMLGTSMQVSFNADPRVSLRDTVRDDVHTNFAIEGSNNNSSLRSIEAVVQKYAAALTVDPQALQSGAQRSIFYRWNAKTNRYQVDYQAIRKARTEIASIKGSKIAALNPKQMEILGKIEIGIDQIAQVDPVGNQLDRWRNAYPQTQTDMRPLRLMSALGGALITGVGLIMGYRTGNFSWPTALWAGVTAVSINPDLVKSGSYNSLKRLEYLNDPTTQNVINKSHLTGDKGAKVVEEAQALNRSKRGNIAALLKSGKPLTLAQMSEIIGEENTPLLQTMASLNDKERAELLKILSISKNRDDQQIVREYIRARDRIEPQLGVNQYFYS